MDICAYYYILYSLAVLHNAELITMYKCTQVMISQEVIILKVNLGTKTFSGLEIGLTGEWQVGRWSLFLRIFGIPKGPLLPNSYLFTPIIVFGTNTGPFALFEANGTKVSNWVKKFIRIQWRCNFHIYTHTWNCNKQITNISFYAKYMKEKLFKSLTWFIMKHTSFSQFLSQIHKTN
jgi:hypothetical protein